MINCTPKEKIHINTHTQAHTQRMALGKRSLKKAVFGKIVIAKARRKGIQEIKEWEELKT